MKEVVPQSSGVESRASVRRLEIRAYSPDLEEHSWRTNFSHMWPAAALLGP